MGKLRGFLPRCRPLGRSYMRSRSRRLVFFYCCRVSDYFILLALRKFPLRWVLRRTAQTICCYHSRASLCRLLLNFELLRESALFCFIQFVLIQSLRLPIETSLILEYARVAAEKTKSENLKNFVTALSNQVKINVPTKIANIYKQLLIGLLKNSWSSCIILN